MPQKLLDTCAFIEDLLGEDAWQAKLKKHHKRVADEYRKKSVLEVVLTDELKLTPQNYLILTD